MRTNLLMLLPLIALLARPVAAQQGKEPAADATTAARQRLAAALRKTADAAATSFSLRWAPRKQEADDDANDPLRAMLAGGSGMSGSASGAWFDDLRAVSFEGTEGDELLLQGTRMIARDGTRPWTRRTGRFADGNTIEFVPDPAALLAQLAEWPLAVTRRDAGAIDDRPVEVVSVTLNADQVAELLWSGALPPIVGTPGIAANRVFVQRIMAGRLGGAGAARAAAMPPDVTVDLAIAIDPGTGLVHELRARSWGKAGDAGLNALLQGNRVQIGVAGAAPAQKKQNEEPAADRPSSSTGPVEYENGLPKRDAEDMAAIDVGLRLTDHGAAKPPVLTEQQQRLLR